MCKYFKGFPEYLAFGIGGGFHAQILDNSLGKCSTKSDAQITYAHSPKVISRTKGVEYTNANVNGLLGQSEDEKWKRSLPLITKP
jgi:hypothetical protein